MAWTSDRPLMAPIDSDQLFKLVWNLLDSSEAFEKDDNNDKMAKCIRARVDLIDFITEHPNQFLDLIERGKCSDWRREYISDLPNLPNGAADTTKAYPAYWDEEENRYWTVREMWHAPRKEEEESG